MFAFGLGVSFLLLLFFFTNSRKKSEMACESRTLPLPFKPLAVFRKPASLPGPKSGV